MSTNSLTPKSLHATGIAMAVISSTVFAVRMYLGFVKRRRVSWEDGFLIVAWTFFFAVTVMYLQATSLIFRIEALATGKVTPANYPGDLAADTLRIQITFFITTIGLWLCLWCVKASLMTLYKRLMANLQPWITCWWIVVVVCLLVCPFLVPFRTRGLTPNHD